MNATPQDFPTQSFRARRLPLVLLSGALAIVTGLVAGSFFLRNDTTLMAADSTGPPVPAPIDGNRAYGYLKRICDLGPRPAGSEANTRQRQLVADHFRKHGGTIREQPFNGRDPLTRKPVAMVNLIGSWYPDRTDRVIVMAHYDTRPYPDQDPDPENRKVPFLGANDCASGVGLLMEIAQHLNQMKTPWGVDLVLLDGEELVYERTGEYFLGSKEFARVYERERSRAQIKYRYVAGILLDLIGGKDLRIEKEVYSQRLAPELLRQVWGVARRLNVPEFVELTGQEVLDDHLALNSAGIPTIDIIDFDYPQWHTLDDTPEHCSPRSLEAVGKVVTAWLNEPKPVRRRR